MAGAGSEADRSILEARAARDRHATRHDPHQQRAGQWTTRCVDRLDGRGDARGECLGVLGAEPDQVAVPQRRCESKVESTGFAKPGSVLGVVARERRVERGEEEDRRPGATGGETRDDVCALPVEPLQLGVDSAIVQHPT